MNLKIFLPMGGKPPDKFGRGRDASSIQVSLIIAFPRFCQVLQELLVLPSASMSSTICSLIVIIFYDICFPLSAEGYEIVLVSLMQLLPSKTRQLTTTTAATTTTTITTDHHYNSHTTPAHTHKITTTNTAHTTVNTTTNHNSLETTRPFIVIILYDSRLPPPAAATFRFGSAMVVLLQCSTHQLRINVTTTTPTSETAHTFTFVTYHDTCLAPVDTFGSGRVLVAPIQTANLSSSLVAFHYATSRPPGSMVLSAQSPTFPDHHTKTFVISRYQPLHLGTLIQPLQHVLLTAPTACLTSASRQWLKSTSFLLLPSGTAIIKSITFPPVSSPATITNDDHDITTTQWNILHNYSSPSSTSVPQNVTVSAAGYSAPSSILDGALTILVQPSCNRWCSLLLQSTSSHYPALSLTYAYVSYICYKLCCILF
jgi:hypothetical protein